jgi:hypothetical protein
MVAGYTFLDDCHKKALKKRVWRDAYDNQSDQIPADVQPVFAGKGKGTVLAVGSG